MPQTERVRVSWKDWIDSARSLKVEWNAESAVTLAFSFAAFFFAGLALRVRKGLGLNLYLVHREPGQDGSRADTTVTLPITAPFRRAGAWKTLRDRRWKEDQTLELTDYQNFSAQFRITFGLLRHYCIRLESDESTQIRLNGRPLSNERTLSIRSKDLLQIGNRTYTFEITSVQLEQRFSKVHQSAA